MWHTLTESSTLQHLSISQWHLSEMQRTCGAQVVRLGDQTVSPGTWTLIPDLRGSTDCSCLVSPVLKKLSHYTKVHFSWRCRKTSWKCFVGGASPSWKHCCDWEVWASPFTWEAPPGVPLWNLRIPVYPSARAQPQLESSKWQEWPWSKAASQTEQAGICVLILQKFIPWVWSEAL